MNNLLLVLFAVIFTVCLTTVIIGIAKDIWEPWVEAGLPVIIALMVPLAASIVETIKPDVKEITEEYNILCLQLEECDADTPFILLDKLYDDCVEFDKKIDKHHKLYTSEWRGRGYSEEIGNLPKLVPIFKEKFDM